MARVNDVTNRPEQILGVATNLFFEKGYSRVGVDDIGAAAGLTGPAIYRHFKSKGEILAALFDQAIDGILSATGSTATNPSADLEHRVQAHARYVLGHRKLASIWIREGRALSDEHRARLRRREMNYVRQWIDCIERCYPERNRGDTEAAALTALGTLNSMSIWPKTHAGQSAVEDIVSDFVLAGLRRLGRGQRDKGALAG